MRGSDYIKDLGYRSEDKRYEIQFYHNQYERQERYGCTRKVIGIIENFNPMGQTAIRDDNDDLWFFDSRLIAVMKPIKMR